MKLDYREARAKLASLGVRPSKERGQNFLLDSSVIQEIVDWAAPAPDESLVEIGPGLGALSKELSALGPLVVIEIEKKFCDFISSEFDSVRVINEDVRKVNFSELGSNLLVFGNLPYSFSSEIVFHILDQGQSISRAIFLLQKEFVQRMAAPHGSRTYGVLSISVQTAAAVKTGPVIPGSAFYPETKVESQLVQLKPRSKPLYEIEDMQWFKKVVSSSFCERRRTIKNSLTASGIAAAEQIDRALESAGIAQASRAESLSIADFVSLARNLIKP